MRADRNAWHPVSIALALVASATQAGTALLLGFFNLVYPPLAMFAAAVVAGLSFRGRPGTAARIGVAVGLLGGFFAEWVFFVVRLRTRPGLWRDWTMLERLGITAGEWIMYAALLAFFAAFFAWVSEPRPPSTSWRSEDESSLQDNLGVRFNPEEGNDRPHDLPLQGQDEE